MDDDIKEMKAETTEKALEFIKTNSHMKAMVEAGKNKKLTIKEMADHLRDASVHYAYAHGNKFGDLFDVELDLVEWTNIVSEV